MKMKRTKIEIDLSNLPQDKNGNIFWNQCVGELVPFIYNDEVDYLKIAGYCKQQVTLQYEQRIRRFHVRDIYYGHIEPLLGVYTQKFLYEVGAVIGEFKILEQIFITHHTEETESKYLKGKQERKFRGYKIQCIHCAKEYEIKQKNINDGNINIKCDCEKKRSE